MFFLQSYLYLSTHTQERELTAGLAGTWFYLNRANALSANSWKFKAAGSRTLLTHVACDKKPHFCIYVCLSV